MDLVKSETRNRNIVTIMVVHDLNIALRYGDYVVMLKKANLLPVENPKRSLRQRIWLMFIASVDE